MLTELRAKGQATLAYNFVPESAQIEAEVRVSVIIKTIKDFKREVAFHSQQRFEAFQNGNLGYSEVKSPDFGGT
jgi:hypothetical protein